MGTVFQPEASGDASFLKAKMVYSVQPIKFPFIVHVHLLQSNILITHGLLPSGLAAQSLQQW